MKEFCKKKSGKIYLERFCAISLGFLVWLCLPFPTFSQIAPERQADSAKRCAICHYTWVYTFFEEHSNGELATLPEAPFIEKKEMCFSCHDGSITDDRERVYNDPAHRVGIVPPDEMRTPGDLPLHEEGRIQCLTCHTHHSAPRD